MRTSGNVIPLGEEIGWSARSAIYIFPGASGTVSGGNKVSLPCDHGVSSMKLLALDCEGQDLLLIACNDCQEFTLFVMQGRDINAMSRYSFDSPVQCMVSGEPGIVYVSDPYGSVQEFQYSLSEFKPINKIIDTQLQLSDMCYLPAPYTAIVCCFVKSYFDGETTIRAISKTTNKIVWALKKRADVKAVLHVQEDDVIIANDVLSRRLLVLNPGDGSYCYVVRYVVRYCEFKPEWSQLQLDLFLIFIWTYSRHLHCLLCVYYV